MTDFTPKFSLQRPYNRTAPDQDAAQFSLAACGFARLEDQLESDRGRIINSAAIRRLQQKTQVFPLERNAAVRSRLTHSLEVQQTGRFITRTVFKKLGSRAAEVGLSGAERAVESLVEMACLMHDIGNPPFGHFGEAAISKWFHDHLGELKPFSSTVPGSLTEKLATELQSFEGNAQAIRLISSLLKLNLTYSQAATVFKYTRAATEPKPPRSAPLSYLQKKPGYYFSERRFVTEMQNAVDMAPGHRYPFSYLMEAADDISYCLADMEDGVDKGLLTYKNLATLLIESFERRHPDDRAIGHFKGQSFREVVNFAARRAEQEPINKEHEFFVWLRVKLIHPLVEHAASAFVSNLDQVCQGNLNRALLEDESACHSVIATFKEVAIAHIFSVPEVETLELQGYRIITGLLDLFKPLLVLSQAEFLRLIAGEQSGLMLESRLFRRLPNKHIRAYFALRDAPCDEVDSEVWEQYCRCRLVQDMVSGMTDQFALDEFHRLSVTGP